MGNSPPVYLHPHRTIPGNPEKLLGKLLGRLLLEKHQGDILAASNAYANEKTAQALAQILMGHVIDREELYDSLIAWAKRELNELTSEGEVVRFNA
jgi:hypothetical protein